MGKAAKLKRLRKAANDLPVVNRQMQVPGELVRGRELIEKGIDKLPDGTELEPSLMYRQGKIIEVPLNHYSTLKKAYNKGGNAHAGAYAKAVLDHVKEHTITKAP